MSAPHGVGQINPNQNSAVFKKKKKQSQLDSFIITSNLKLMELERQLGHLGVLKFLLCPDAFLRVMAKHQMLG